jgi:hypothetical protein
MLQEPSSPNSVGVGSPSSSVPMNALFGMFIIEYFSWLDRPIFETDLGIESEECAESEQKVGISNLCSIRLPGTMPRHFVSVFFHQMTSLSLIIHILLACRR